MKITHKFIARHLDEANGSGIAIWELHVLIFLDGTKIGDNLIASGPWYMIADILNETKKPEAEQMSLIDFVDKYIGNVSFGVGYSLILSGEYRHG